MKKKKIVLTAVVPAKNGCNLHCAGCIITQRGEARNSVLTSDDYLRFIGDVIAMPEVVSISLQGYEILLPDAWPLAKELLSIATKATTPEGVDKRVLAVTNGVYLSRFADEIVHITDNLSVSVDSHDPATHDLSRGKVGAWKDTINGIRAVRALFPDQDIEMFQEYLGVVSILYPGKVNRLRNMPALLGELGVKRWTVSPLITTRKGGYHGDYKLVQENILSLADKASEHGVEVFLADDLRRLESVGDLYKVLSVAAVASDHIVVRLSPDGSFSIGEEILETASGSQKWDRIESPVEFVRRTVMEKYP